MTTPAQVAVWLSVARLLLDVLIELKVRAAAGEKYQFGDLTKELVRRFSEDGNPELNEHLREMVAKIAREVHA